jgi:hypothetical protein
METKDKRHLIHTNGWDAALGTLNWRQVRSRLMRGRDWCVVEAR